MADNQPAEEQTTGQLQRHLPRIRYLPDWEIPIGPPNRRPSLLSRTKISRSIRRSRVAAMFRPKPNFVDASRPTSDTSIQNTKESFVDTGGIHGIPPLSRSSTAPELSPRPLHRIIHTLPPRRYFGGLTRRTLVLVAVAILLAIGLSLGLGLGLGLHRDAQVADVQSADPQPAGLPSPNAPPPSTPFSDAPSPTPRVYQGNLTYFSPGLGVCGWKSSDTDAVCAIPHDIFDAAAPRVSSGGIPGRNPLCGRLIRVTTFLAAAGNTKKPVSVVVMVADRCVDCEGNDLDLSPGTFKQIASEGSGVVSGTWQWL